MNMMKPIVKKYTLPRRLNCPAVAFQRKKFQRPGFLKEYLLVWRALGWESGGRGATGKVTVVGGVV